mmetsp:Transcript_23315/g.58450  ORF Transcript_23315/g.58450 Transcript_23315/m.58450 type:complete len:278 (+) Transcript_23315:221-1054(+)
MSRPPPPAYQAPAAHNSPGANQHRPPPPYGAPGAVTIARHQGGGMGMEATMTRVKVSSVRDAGVMAQLGQEVSLDDSSRHDMELLANYYAIVRSMERLEKAYIGGGISDDKVYEQECQKLIPRFATLREGLPEDMQDPRTSIPTFMSKYHLQANFAANRFSIGVPATVSVGGGGDSSTPKALHVAEAVQAYITVMDSLRLNMCATDQIHPLTTDIVNALNKIAVLPPDFEPRAKVKKWLQTLSAMRATDELDEDQTRQFLFDLEASHQEFVQWLHNL